MDSEAAERLAQRLSDVQEHLCQRVAIRLLAAFPELVGCLQRESAPVPEARLAKVASEPLCKLVCSMLIIESFEVADAELHWASVVLPRQGVTLTHQSTMVCWFFEEVRHNVSDPAELSLTHTLEDYLLGVIEKIYTH